MKDPLDTQHKIAGLHVVGVAIGMLLFIVQCILGIVTASQPWYIIFGIAGIINCAILIQALSLFYRQNQSWEGSFRHWKIMIVCLILTILFFIP